MVSGMNTLREYVTTVGRGRGRETGRERRDERVEVIAAGVPAARCGLVERERLPVGGALQRSADRVPSAASSRSSRRA